MVSLSGALSGGISGAALGGPWGAAAGGLAGLFLGGNEEDLKLTDQRTPQQIEAANILQQLATTGSGAGITLGQPYGGSLGNYDLSALEQSGLSQLFNQQTNPFLSQAGDVFGKLSQAAFDPSVLDPFTKAAKRAQSESNDILNREAAITGNRFGTQILGEKRQLAENTQNSIQQQLANLFLNQQQVSAQGAQGLLGVGQAQFGQQQSNLQNLFNFGGLERDLKNQEAQAQFNEFNRQRGEKLGQIDLLGQEANRNPLLGVSSIPGNPTGFQNLINSVLGGVGTGLGESIGGSLGNYKKRGA